MSITRGSRLCFTFKSTIPNPAALLLPFVDPNKWGAFQSISAFVKLMFQHNYINLLESSEARQYQVYHSKMAINWITNIKAAGSDPLNQTPAYIWWLVWNSWSHRQRFMINETKYYLRYFRNVSFFSQRKVAWIFQLKSICNDHGNDVMNLFNKTEQNILHSKSRSYPQERFQIYECAVKKSVPHCKI